MKTKFKTTFVLMLLMASFSLNAQTTNGNGAGTGGNDTDTYIGAAAGSVNTALYNTFIGSQSGQSNTTGQQNSFLGHRTGYQNTTGSFNSFIGVNAGQANTTASANVFLGVNSGRNNRTGQRNSFIGTNSGYRNTEGHYNTFSGYYAGFNNTTADRNTFIGYEAGRVTSTGSNNIYLGYRAGYAGNGGNNLMLGYQAGRNATGSRNVFLGLNAGYNETGSDRLYIDNSGTTTPLIYGDFSSNVLTFNGDVRIANPNGNTGFNLRSSSTANGWHNRISFSDASNTRHVIADNFTNGRLIISPGFDGNAANMVQVNGSLLVGNGVLADTPPGYDLYVTEGILTEKVKVAAYGSIDWADYVFEDDYELNSLEEVEQFVKTNKHLPNVPSAKEVNEEGVDMVEMDATLLRQIEELWLHVIELKKENETLKAEVAELK